MRSTLPVVAVAALFAVGCAQESNQLADDYSRVLPDERIEANMQTQLRREVGEPSEAFSDTAQVVTDINTLIDDVLTWVDLVTDEEPTWSDGETVATWGPWNEGAGTPDISLWVGYDEGKDEYEWAFVLRDQGGSDADWDPVIAGNIEGDATEDDSTGAFVIDFTTIAQYDSTTDVIGLFAVGYDVDADGANVEAIFDDFGSNDDSGVTTDAAYYYDQSHDGEGHIDLAYLEDITGDGTQEIHIMRSRWKADGSGRADIALAGGEIDDDVFAYGIDCWGQDARTVYEAAAYEIDGTPYAELSGDPEACAFTDEAFNDSHEEGDDIGR